MSRFALYKGPLPYLLIIVVIIAYINREALFEDTGEEVVVTAEQGENDSQQQGQVAREETDSDAPVSEVAVDSLPADDMHATVSTEEAPAEAPAEEAPAAAVAEALPVLAPAESAPGANAVPVAQDDRGADTSTVDTAQLWQQARAQVWSGDYQRSIEQYRQLLALQPDNYDAHGELGDIYLGMRRYEEAGSSYLEAGRLLIKAGYARHAARLLPMLNDIAPERAEELRRLLWPQPAAVGRMP